MMMYFYHRGETSFSAQIRTYLQGYAQDNSTTELGIAASLLLSQDDEAWGDARTALLNYQSLLSKIQDEDTKISLLGSKLLMQGCNMDE